MKMKSPESRSSNSLVQIKVSPEEYSKVYEAGKCGYSQREILMRGVEAILAESATEK